MKTRYILILSFVALLLIIYFYPSNSSEKNEDYVFDNGHELTSSQVASFDSLFKSHEKKTTNEIALVTTESYGSNETILNYAVNFGREHGIGKKNINNGVVIVYNGKSLEIMISTGLGTEKVLKDEVVKKIIDSLMVPNFKLGQTFPGLWAGSKGIVEFLERPENKIK